MRSYQTLQGEKYSLVRCFGNESVLEPKGEQWLEQGERASITWGLLPFLLPDTFLLSDLGWGLDLSLWHPTQKPQRNFLPLTVFWGAVGWSHLTGGCRRHCLTACLRTHYDLVWVLCQALGHTLDLRGFCSQPVSRQMWFSPLHSWCHWGVGIHYVPKVPPDSKTYGGVSGNFEGLLPSLLKNSPEIFIKRGRSQNTWVQVPSI